MASKTTKHSTISTKLELTNPQVKYYYKPQKSKYDTEEPEEDQPKKKLDKHFVYESGDIVKGNVFVHVKEEQTVDRVILKFVGVAWHKRNPLTKDTEDINSVIAFNLKHRRAKVFCVESKKLIDATKILEYNEKYGEKNPFATSGKMKAQVHRFGFEFRIANMLKSKEDDEKMESPPTYEDANIKILWFLHLEVVRPEPARSVHLLQPIQVMPRINERANPDFNVGFAEVNKYLPLRLFGAGAVEAKLVVKKMGVVPGESLPIDVIIDNNSGKYVKGIDFKLVRYMDYVGLDGKVATTKEVILRTYKEHIVGPGSKTSKFSTELKFPSSVQIVQKIRSKDDKETDEEESMDEEERERYEQRHPSPKRFLTSLYLQLDLYKTITVDHVLHVCVHVGGKRRGLKKLLSFMTEDVRHKTCRGVEFNVPLLINAFQQLKNEYDARTDKNSPLLEKEVTLGGVLNEVPEKAQEKEEIIQLYKDKKKEERGKGKEKGENEDGGQKPKEKAKNILENLVPNYEDMFEEEWDAQEIKPAKQLRDDEKTGQEPTVLEKDKKTDTDSTNDKKLDKISPAPKSPKKAASPKEKGDKLNSSGRYKKSIADKKEEEENEEAD